MTREGRWEARLTLRSEADLRQRYRGLVGLTITEDKYVKINLPSVLENLRIARKWDGQER